MTEPRRVDDWDERSSDRVTGEPLSPWVLVIAGAVVTVLGAVVGASGEHDGVRALLVAVGGAAALVGLVALGVMLGLRRQRWLDRHRTG